MDKNLKIVLAILAALVILYVLWSLLQGPSGTQPPSNNGGGILNW